MNREPKVACIELDCERRDLDKNCRQCMECRPRVDFDRAISLGIGMRQEWSGFDEYHVAIARARSEALFT